MKKASKLKTSLEMLQERHEKDFEGTQPLEITGVLGIAMVGTILPDGYYSTEVKVLR